MSSQREFKDPLYAQFARIGHALSTPRRIEFLDLLAQAERTVAELAEETGTPIKNTSAHLRALRLAGLVETRKDAQFVHYRLAGEDVHRLVQQLQAVAHDRFAEVERVTNEYLDGRDDLEAISVRELQRRMREDDVTVIDVRPRAEYESGHIPGALSLPIDQLRRGAVALPKRKEIVAYCRGRYCVYAVDAVNLLRKRGHTAVRLVEGLPGWRRDVRTIATGTDR